MKSLLERLNEALGDVAPKQFVDIWKGKNPSIDEETVNNSAYFSNELCNVHRSKLPTPEEFTNVCNWLVNNTSWVKKDVEALLMKIMETYLQTTDIMRTGEVVKFSPEDIRFIRYGKGINLFNDNLQLMAALALFFNMHYKGRTKTSVMNQCKRVCANMFEPAFKKYNVSWKTWPDYSEGFDILLNNF